MLAVGFGWRPSTGYKIRCGQYVGKPRHVTSCRREQQAHLERIVEPKDANGQLAREAAIDKVAGQVVNTSAAIRAAPLNRACKRHGQVAERMLETHSDGV